VLGLTPLEIGILLVTGLAAGFINTLAGAGSLLSVPALMLAGLPADIANATNRISVLATSISGGVGFQQAGRLHTRAVVLITLPTLAGAAAGAFGATRLPEPILKGVLLVTMVVMGLLLALKPRALAPPDGSEPIDVRSRPSSLLWLFIAGAYGGFLQAGVGLILLAILGGALRYDLVRANALKAVITGSFTAVALTIFVLEGKVRWAHGGFLAAGTVVGAQLAVRFAVRRGEAALRKVLLVMVIALCVAAALR
jgi:uncharacterized protein